MGDKTKCGPVPRASTRDKLPWSVAQARAAVVLGLGLSGSSLVLQSANPRADLLDFKELSLSILDDGLSSKPWAGWEP